MPTRCQVAIKWQWKSYWVNLGAELVRRQAAQKRESCSLTAERSLCIYQARVKNLAGTVLHSCASTSLTQRIAPQANSHPSAAKACKSVGLQDCGSEVGKWRARQLLLSPVLVPTGVFAGGWDCWPGAHQMPGRRDRDGSCLDPCVPPIDRSLTFLTGTLLSITPSWSKEILSRTLVFPTNSRCLLPSFSPDYAYVLSRDQLFVTPWVVARQAPLSMEFSRQEYWSELPCPPPRVIFPTQGSNQYLLHWQAVSFTTSATWEAQSFL